MSQSRKIIISVVVTLVIIGVGFVLLQNLGESAVPSNDNSPSAAERIMRPLMNGGVPGDGGGG